MYIPFMGFVEKLTDLIYGSERDITPAPTRLIGFPTDGGLMSGGVTSTTSLGLSAVWRSLDILANGVSQLEWYERRGNVDLPLSRIVSRPQAERTRREWVSLVVSTLALYDVCYLYKSGGIDSEGVPIALWPLDPVIVTPLYTDPYHFIPPTEYMVANTKISSDELIVLHRSPQPSIQDNVGGVLNLARTTFATAMAAERYASRYWQSGGSATTVLESDQTMPDAIATQLADRWSESRRRGPDHPAVLTSGMKARPFGADPTQQSAVEARRELVADVGRYFGVPTALLNAPAGDSETYRSTESQGIDLVKYTIQNYITAIEDAITDQLPGGRRLCIDTSALIRGDQITRAQSYQLAISSGWMTVNEVREQEGLPPLDPTDIPAPQPALPSTDGQPA